MFEENIRKKLEKEEKQKGVDSIGFSHMSAEAKKLAIQKAAQAVKKNPFLDKGKNPGR